MKDTKIICFLLLLAPYIVFSQCQAACGTLGCIYNQLTACLSCSGGNWLQEYNYGSEGNCIATCAGVKATITGNNFCILYGICPGSYYRDGVGLCHPTANNCYQTRYDLGSGLSTDPCGLCNTGYYVQSAGTSTGSCVTTCTGAGKQIVAGGAICNTYALATCNAACSTCSAFQNPYFCTSCPVNNYLAPTDASQLNPLQLRTCTATLPARTYTTSQFTGGFCYLTCSECLGPNIDDCIKCYTNGYLMVTKFTNSHYAGVCKSYSNSTYPYTFTYSATPVLFSIIC